MTHYAQKGVTVIPVSGGIDSLILADANPGATLVFVRYGQPYLDQEQRAVYRLYGDRVRFVDVGGVDTSREYVPARNLIIACIAAQFGDTILIGGLADDNAADQSTKAAEEMSTILSNQCGYQVSVSMPLSEYCKAEAVSFYLNEPETIEGSLLKMSRIRATFSCYAEDSASDFCGDCSACFRRSTALLANGVDVQMPHDRIVLEYMQKLHNYHPDRVWAIFKALQLDGRVLLCVDIDGVLTVETSGRNYSARTPRKSAIDNLRMHVDSGALVVLYTARPSWDRAETVDWLQKNGVPFHSLFMGKFPALKYIDDLSLTDIPGPTDSALMNPPIYEGQNP